MTAQAMEQPAAADLPEVDERGQCIACGRYPNDGDWCMECDGEPACPVVGICGRPAHGDQH